MKKSFFLTVVIIVFCYIFFSCSSAPKRAMKITVQSDAAATRYEGANSELSTGKFDLALIHFSQAYNLAFSVDDADLLCRISLSGISYKIATGTLNATDEDSDSFISSMTVEQILSEAKYFAERSPRSQLLLAVCNIYEVEAEKSRGKKNYLFYESLLKDSENALSKEPYYLALLYRSMGDVGIAMNNYDSAASLYSSAAEIHTKNRYLFEIGTDYYGAARAFSLSGNKEKALSSMEKALKFDKDAENTTAIASDYFAIAKILMKGSVTIEEKKKARESAKWASSIYKSAGLKTEAEKCEKFLSEIK